MEQMKSCATDPFWHLDAKLQAALQKITKSEQCRRLAILQEELALSGQLISGRQHLLFMYLDFAKDRHRTDSVAYKNLEKINFRNPTDEAGLDNFLSLWDLLLASFKKQPTEYHLYAKFHEIVKNLPSLK
eukprot:2042713-Heterocapsa_arctica.AAC.1